jgi:hypothetical protein
MESEPEYIPNADSGQNDPETSPTQKIAGATKSGGKKKKKEGLGSSRGIETMFRTSYRVHMDLSSIADTKANIMISINGLIISILIASLSSKIDTHAYLLIPTSIMLLGCLTSTVIAVISARPRVNSQYISLDDVRKNKANLLFFGHFSKMELTDFEEGMTELLKNSTILYQNMIRDIYGLGLVLNTKFRLLRMAYTSFMIALTLGILAYITVYAWVVLSQEITLIN